MIRFSDLHLRPESEEVCRQVLDAVHALALNYKEPVAFHGDFWHVRYSVPVYLQNMVRRTLHRWVETGVPAVYILPGNHDQVDVAGNHALEVFGDIRGVRVFTEPTLDPETGQLWLPYRRDTRELVEAAKRAPPGTVANLHHGVVGALMNNGVVASERDGIHPDDLSHLSTVFCGHWHRHQQIRNCVYVGSQWQTKSDEAGQVKGVLRSTGSQWQFIPLSIGKRFHSNFAPEDIAGFRKGDTARVPSGTSAQLVDALQSLGVEVVVAPDPGQTQQRLGTAHTLRDQAAAYVGTQPIPEGVTEEELMRVFDEIAGSA